MRIYANICALICEYLMGILAGADLVDVVLEDPVADALQSLDQPQLRVHILQSISINDK